MTTLAIKNGVTLGKKGELFVVSYRTGSLTVTSQSKANDVFNALSK